MTVFCVGMCTFQEQQAGYKVIADGIADGIH